MATFKLVTQLGDVAVFTPLLKTALAKVKADTPVKFLYFSSVNFGARKAPLLLVDYESALPPSLPGKPSPLAKGEVTLTADGELHFPAPKAICEQVQKYLIGLKLPHKVAIPEERPEATVPAAVLPKALQPMARATTAPAPPPIAEFTRGTPTKAAAPTKIVGPPGQRTAAPGPVPQNAAAAPPQPTPAPRGRADATAAANRPPNVAAAQKAVQPPPAKNAPSPSAAKPAASPAADTKDMEAVKTFQTQKNLYAQLDKLAALPWTDTTDAEKARMIGKLRDLVQAGKFAAVESDIKKLTNEEVDPYAPRMAKADGVPSWFLSKADRKAEGEKIVEEAIALKELIEAKTAKNATLQKNWEATRQKLETGIPNEWLSLNGEANLCLDPVKMKGIYEAFLRLRGQKADLAELVRPLWIDKQEERLKKETGKSKDGAASKMVAGMGQNAFLEMAQMSELMAKKSAKGFDPYDAKGSKGRLLKDMEMAEVASVYGYSTQDFTTINGIMRGLKTNPAEDAPMPGAPTDGKPKMDYRPYIAACTNALQKLPVYKGTVVRAEKTLFKTIVDSLLESGTRSDKAFMSGGLKKVPGFGSIIMHIDTIKTGREITMLSLHEKEGEVLFPPGATFKFKKFTDGTTTITDYADFTEDMLTKMTAGEFWYDEV